MKLIHIIQKGLRSESAGGCILILATFFAMVVANSTWRDLYFSSLAAYIGQLSVLHWINDGLMVLFFLVIGLELKREMMNGELANGAQRILPGLAALGGAIVPALIYVAINSQENGALNGWAIPAATDIAFALGVLSILGSRVPTSLKIFLTALAIIDDIAAIIIIALFYTNHINLYALLGVAALMAVLFLMNKRGGLPLFFYLIVGSFLWIFMLKSGVHATIAGVILALFIPHHTTNTDKSPLLKLEHHLHPWVTFLIIPLFAFANAGIALDGLSLDTFGHPVTLGIMLGLLLGKPIGIFLFSYCTLKLQWATMPEGANVRQLFGVSILCGIGFTMSLFIGLLAFSEDAALLDATKIGVIVGSLLSVFFALLVLTTKQKK